MIELLYVSTIKSEGSLQTIAARLERHGRAAGRVGRRLVALRGGESGAKKRG